MTKFMQVPLEKAHIVLRLVQMAYNSMFILPVIMLIYQFKGLSVGDFFLIQSIFAIAILFLEIPTGYIGDLFSRKKVISLAIMFYFAGYLVLYFFSGFTSVVTTEILWGVCSALYSGTGTAYLFDVLQKQGREKDFLKEQSKIKTYSCGAGFFSTILGGYLYTHLGPDKTILAEVFLIGIALLITLILPEFNDFQRKVEKGKNKFKDILDICKYAINHKELKYLMIFPAAFSTCTVLIFWSLQPIMKFNSVPVEYFGFFIAVSQFFRMVYSHYGQKLFKKLKTRNFTLLLVSILTAGCVLVCVLPSIGNLLATYVILVLLGAIVALHVPIGIVSTSMINHRIKSDERATVLSVNAMLKSVLSSVVLGSVKFAIDGVDLQAILLVMTPIIMLLVLISMKKLLRLKLA